MMENQLRGNDALIELRQVVKKYQGAALMSSSSNGAMRGSTSSTVTYVPTRA